MISMSRWSTLAAIAFAFALFSLSACDNPATSQTDVTATPDASAAPHASPDTLDNASNAPVPHPDAEIIAPAADRPATWAQPIAMPGLPNLHKINDHLYRGAQPTDEGFAQLKQMGVKTVISLRAFHSDRDQCNKNGLDYERISFKSWHPEAEDVVCFLKIITDPARQPVFFHCQHGADRTGTMSALYRIALEGWSKEDAVKEMTTGGYGFHPLWQNLVDYINNLDVDDIKQQADL